MSLKSRALIALLNDMPEEEVVDLLKIMINRIGEPQFQRLVGSLYQSIPNDLTNNLILLDRAWDELYSSSTTSKQIAAEKLHKYISYAIDLRDAAFIPILEPESNPLILVGVDNKFWDLLNHPVIAHDYTFKISTVWFHGTIDDDDRYTLGDYYDDEISPVLDDFSLPWKFQAIILREK